MSVQRDFESGVITISVEHQSPVIARKWVQWLVDDLNKDIMTRDVVEARQAIEYLERQVDETLLSDMRAVFFSLIREQMKVILLAEVSEEYVFEVIDPAVEPEIKNRPRRSIIVVIATILAGIFSVSFVIVRSYWRRTN
jgi:LPS O-antigen subunit length determinant protein (WzzB/FepE family)